MKLSIIIVSFNVKYYLEQCLHSVQRAITKLDAEIWVVDNASTDGTPIYIRPRFPNIHFIENTENKGFSRANNIAIKKCTGEYILLLNPDTIVGEDTISGCIRFMDKNNEAGATGVKMIGADGSFAYESRRGLPTPFTSFCKMTGLGSLFPNSPKYGKYYMRYLDKEQTNQIEVVSGAFCLLRHSALKQTGLLDEDFFMYGEDIDLSYRMLQCGFKNYYQPLPILHYKGESTHKSSFKYVNVFYKAMLIFFNKHYRKNNKWLAPLIQTAVVIRGIMDYCIRQYNRLFHTLGIEMKDSKEESFLFLGRAESIEEVCRLSLNKNLNIDFVEADRKNRPHGHHGVSRQLEQYDYIVYDTSAYSYKQILSFIAKQTGKHRLRLGTFSPQTGRLITMENVY